MTRNRKQDAQRHYGAAALFSRLFAGNPSVVTCTTNDGMSWSEEQLCGEGSPP